MAKVFGLSTPLAVGLILVGCCPGGTASNLVTYIAHANVALSVVLTTCSTILVRPARCTPSPSATLRQLRSVKTNGDCGHVQGCRCHAYAYGVAGGSIGAGTCGWPSVIYAEDSAAASRAGDRGGPHMFQHHRVKLHGYFECGLCPTWSSILPALLRILSRKLTDKGYSLARLLGYKEAVRRTISIEVGMQNSALGVMLAQVHFANPLTVSVMYTGAVARKRFSRIVLLCSAGGTCGYLGYNAFLYRLCAGWPVAQE
eukprot:scaffold4163_cov425-Prasinococcus_capsulatus_cf.AAC.13